MFISELSANSDISLSVPHTQLSYGFKRLLFCHLLS